MPAPREITTTQLNRLIGTPDVPVVIDVRIEADFEDDPFVIPGSLRLSHTDLATIAQRTEGRACVIVCQQGHKLSQGVCAWLNAQAGRDQSLRAEYLQGGMFAWRDDAEALRIPAAVLSTIGQSPSRWVTRHRPKIDRIACPWLIRRFVDPDAQFLFVAPGEVLGVAQAFSAIPFDVENTFWSHRGDRCSFDTMIEEFALTSPALSRLAEVVRAADTNRHDLHPAAAGLLAISVGLSRQYADDQAQLEAGMVLYDALYRWARDGADEGHDWPAKGPRP